MKQYTKDVDTCRSCPNIVRWDVQHEIYRCRVTKSRKNNFRMIHREDWNGTPEWCPLQDVEFIPLPF